jgi:allantoate deiminase
VTRAANNSQSAAEVLGRCAQLANFSDDSQGIHRTFLSPAMRECCLQVEAWMRNAGMRVTMDNAGNLRGLYPASHEDAPTILIGSHLDTVPNAGAYDGILGVMLPIALVEQLAPEKLPLAIEVLAFSEEEGVRFSAPFIGSRALVGRLDDELLARTDRDGISVRQAIAGFGLRPDRIPDAAIDKDAACYLEFHIEQGPVLEHLQLPLGIVDAIAGQTRLELNFRGAANHAGTTPMHLRRDALTAAAEWALVVEQTASATHGLVATVGLIEATPGAVNVIAGECRTTLDIRHASDAQREAGLAKILAAAEEICHRRKISFTTQTKIVQPATPMDPFLVQQIEAAFTASGLTPHHMTSGAGHDAQILAEKIPAAMIFLRSPGGISHNPQESVLVEDVAKALECGRHLLHQLANSREFLTRTRRA